jgi:phage/plasmid-associated DNA primase
MIKEKVWEGCKFNTPLDEIIDKKMSKKPWMMYGSVNYKNNTSTPYLYNNWDKLDPKDRYGHAYDHTAEEIKIKKIFEMEMNGKKNTIKYYLPIFLSIRGYEVPVQLIDELSKKEILSHFSSSSRSRRNIQRKRTDADILEDIKLIEEGGIMDMISNDRADNYADWMDMGWTLFNIGEGRDQTLDMWIEFSKRSEKYKEGECEKLWNQMQLSNKSLASLLYMARVDSPADYAKWKDRNTRQLIFNSISYSSKVNEFDVSKVVVNMFGDRFLCADGNKNVWYHYYEHRWRMMEGEIELRKKILEHVLPKYSEICLELGKSILEAEQKRNMADKDSEEERRYSAEKKELEVKKKKCVDIIDELKTNSFLNDIIKMCKIYMYKPEFLVKMNENRNYIGCENGVLDLELGVFREGKPDDYITFSTGQTYTEYNELDDEVKELDDYFRKVYPNSNIREYFFDFITSSLKGNVHKRFGVFTGQSDGAKSMTITLLEYTFGTGDIGYFGKFPREMMVQSTTKNSSSSSRPELARVRGKMFMASQEITKLEKINIGFVKEATGNDSIYVRSHYEKGTEIRPNFTLLLACNEPPEIPGHDEAMWSRVRVVDHESKFVKPENLKKFPVPESEEEQFKMKRFKADPSLGERIKNIANVLLWKVFRRYMKMKGVKELYEPPEVLISTERYHDNNDVYRKFCQDKIEKVKDQEKAKTIYIGLQEVFSLFKDWHKDEYPSYRFDIGKSTFKTELTKKMGVRRFPEDVYGFDMKKNVWYGYTIIKDEEEEIIIFED